MGGGAVVFAVKLHYTIASISYICAIFAKSIVFREA